MKEITEILKKTSTLGPDETGILATVVDVQGSGYRLPGARMLVLENGDTFGTVSGGCLESDVLERAKKVLSSGTPEVYTYDTAADENSVFSLNMGCRGVIRILLEPIDANSPLDLAIRRVYRYRHAEFNAVVVRSERADMPIGSRFFLGDSTGSFLWLDSDLKKFAASGSHYKIFDYGNVEFAFEAIRPPVKLYVLGAGADAVPLARLGHELGWQVNVSDHRPAFLTSERFPDAELISLNRDIAPQWETDDLSAFVIMNHNYDRDKMLMPGALNSNAFYIGALGPKKRTEQILDELRAGGSTISPNARFRYPAGLDIGGDTPETIALSIIAEIQSVLRHRSGSPLRDRRGSIYDRI